jgi:hypothetical protein
LDDELLEERAAIIAEGCGVSQEEGLRRAVKWRATLRFDGETREVSGVMLPEELDFG